MLFDVIENLVYVPLLGGLLLFILGVVWVPFAALTSGVIAFRRGLPVGEYAGAGAVCSVLFLLPWVLLTARMFHVRQGIMDVIIYSVGYFIWFGVGVAGWVALMGFTWINTFEHSGSIVGAIFLTGLLLTGPIAWVYYARASLRNLRHAYSEEASAPSSVPMLDSVRLFPFVGPIIWALAGIPVVLILWGAVKLEG